MHFHEDWSAKRKSKGSSDFDPSLGIANALGPQQRGRERPGCFAGVPTTMDGTPLLASRNPVII